MTAHLLAPLAAELGLEDDTPELILPDLDWIATEPDRALVVDYLTDLWAELDEDERQAYARALTGIDSTAVWTPLPHQVPPPGAWYLWLLLAGRGTGKTDACAHYMDEHAMGPACLPGDQPHRMGIIAPTLGDASDACVNGPSGLIAHNPSIVETTRKGGTFVDWPNGSTAKLFGAYTPSDVDRLRAGGNRCMVWCEELAAWRHLRDAWDHLRFGLRIGPRPHVIASTTPRNRPTLKRLVKSSTTAVTRATTAENPHLSQAIRDALYDTYGGTRLGLQELEGIILEDVEGAMWSPELVELMRVAPEEAPTAFDRIVVAVDPSWGTTSDECGIIAVGRRGRNAYILADRSKRCTPSEWGLIAAELYWELEADRLIGEGNFQGEQVRLVAKTVSNDTGQRVTFDLVTASRGKRLRAEPVHALCQQGHVRIIGRQPLLEHQLTHWIPPELDDLGDKGDPDDDPTPAGDVTSAEGPTPSDFSPDRLDAMVFAVTDLLLGSTGPARITRPTGRIPSRAERRS